MKKYNIGFIGSGKMAGAIIKGLIKSDFISSENLLATQVEQEGLAEKKQALGIDIILDNKILVQKSDVIFIATKPNQVVDVLKEIIIYKSSNSLKGLKIVDDSNCGKILSLPTKQIFKMIDILVESLSSYRKAGAPRVLFEIACLKMCGLSEESERVIYKEIIKEVPVEVKEEKVALDSQPVIENKVLNEEIKKSFINANTEYIETEVIEDRVDEKNVEEPAVSHETPRVQSAIEPQPINEKVYLPDEEELLNILVQATKDALLKAKQQWVMLPKYLNSVATAKVTGMLLDGIPVAACNNVILIGYNSDAYLNRIYSENNYEEMNNFLRALYNCDIKCYCLTLENFAGLKEKYVTLRQLGKLPRPVPIIIQKRNIAVKEQKDDSVDEGIEYARKLFGDNVIIKEDE